MEGNQNDVITSQSQPPPPPSQPPPPSSISKNNKPEEFIKIHIPHELKGTEFEKKINLMRFLPEKPVCHVPFSFIINPLNKNQKPKHYQKSIISSRWSILNSDDDSEGISIDNQIQYSNTISYLPKREDANKILNIEIKFSSSIFNEGDNSVKQNQNIFSKLFGHSSKTTDSVKDSKENSDPIIVQYRHSILFEKNRELLKISEESNGYKYRVIQYNILAQCYMGGSEFYKLPDYSLSWDNYRRLLLIPQILQYKADIVGLQEVDRTYWQLFKDLNEKGGYSYYPNYNDQEKPPTFDFNNEYREGCFIFFKKEKFTLLKGLELNYRSLTRPDQKLLPKELLDKYLMDPIYKTIINEHLGYSTHHVRHCLALLEDKSTKQKIIVVSKHLFWGAPGNYNYHIQCVQIHLFTEILKHFIISNQLEPNIPVIVCGDFNSSPGSSCYNFMINGVLPNDDYNLTLGGKYSPAFSSDSLSDIRDIKHNFEFKSAYSFRPDGEPKFTIVTNSFSGNIDQIYFSKRFQVKNVLDVGEKKIYQSLPSLTLASDHILLMVDLELL